MKDSYTIVLGPVISEKSYQLIEHNKYTFRVDPRAKKPAIAKAVEDIFSVNVVGVNIIKTRSKPKRRGLVRGRTSSGKKAIVELSEGQKIEFFESM
ncbi:MAG: 50S ribosomal protein L23 [Thermoleophilia bacterium]|nr:50S ribosomal protein L23 [Actinomycetota bacterium]MCL6092833.1 50S ribosomal protein L23 [Actinomycetota bacterium]